VPLAPLPEWTVEAWWGEEFRGRPLDHSDAIAEAKRLLDLPQYNLDCPFEIETDRPVTEDDIAEHRRMLRSDQDENGHERNSCLTSKQISEEMRKFRAATPSYGTTYDNICIILNLGISKIRAISLYDRYWNRRINTPPLDLSIIQKQADDHEQNFSVNEMDRKQRWRYRNKDAADPTTAEHWLSGEIELADYLMGEVLATDSLAELYGPTGKGKTFFCLALAAHIAAGRDFLHWKGPGKPRNVLFVDGELGKRRLKERVDAVVRHLGAVPVGLRIINREDFPDMPPLDTDEGQRWMDDKLEDFDPIDLIVFDNIQHLLQGEQIGSASWKATLPWVQGLPQNPSNQRPTRALLSCSRDFFVSPDAVRRALAPRSKRLISSGCSPSPRCAAMAWRGARRVSID
jgi:AAA domain